MAVFAASSAAAIGGRKSRHRRRARSRWLAVGLGGALVALILAFFVREERVTDRVRDDKTVQVVLPPPPPVPPPPLPEPEPVAETPPEPTPVPIDQPIEETPPPEPANDPAPGNDALTAREGAGPTNYGLARGDGSGRTIGGQPGTGSGAGGGGGFAAYGDRIRLLMQQALQNERDFARGRYTIRLAVTIAPSGRISDLRMLAGSGDSQRDSAILAFLRDRQFPAPPSGLPTVRLEFRSRPAV